MDPQRWQRLQALFDAAIELGTDDRSAYLEEACREDPSLRWQVESLILALDEASHLLDTAVSDSAKASAESAAGRQRFGPYQIERELGRGGMGVVFLARRADDTYRGQVAIKLLLELRSHEQLRRFRIERQILANLQHPHIARLLDAGRTEAGSPYVVMEYVPGTAIHTFCDDRRLNLQERIDLFISVCRAIQYAHQNLVVHRDLKPDNILVTPEGTPKLLDFGIAKLLEAPTEDRAETETGVRLMTPMYASPEQVLGAPVTVATDVYGLGLVLYQLLTGRLPYALKNTNLTEKARIIAQEEPMRPSAAVTNGVPYKTPLTRLKKQLDGDIGTILLTALQKQPARRYDSAAAFADDLERYRHGLPVKCRPDTFGYRAAKFIRRHRVGTAFAAAVLLFLTTFGVLMTIQADRIARERDAATAARAEAQEVSRLLIRLFEVADPSESRGATITARELLERGAEKVVPELEDQPTIQASMMESIGRVYRNLGLYTEADRMLTGALATRRRLFDEGHPAISTSLMELGYLHYTLGEYKDAERLLRQALAMQETAPQTPLQARSNALDGLANVLSDQGRYDEAIALHRQVLAIDRQIHAGDHASVASALVNLGAALRRVGQFDDAEPLLREGLAMRRRLFGDIHVDVGHALNQLARLLVLKGDPAAAEPIAREGLAVRRKVFGNVHVEVAASLGGLAEILARQDSLDEAIALRKETLSMLRTLFADNHPYVAAALGSLARAEHQNGDLSGAEAHYRAAVELNNKLGIDSLRAARPLHGLGTVLLALDRPAEAEPRLREALTRRRAGLPADHSDVAQSERLLGLCLTELQRYDEAEPLLNHAAALLRTKHGADDARAKKAQRAVDALIRRRAAARTPPAAGR